MGSLAAEYQERTGATVGLLNGIDEDFADNHTAGASGDGAPPRRVVHHAGDGCRDAHARDI